MENTSIVPVDIEILMNEVKSSNIARAGYSAEHKILSVHFKNGTVYHYREVPQEVYNNFMASPSHGAYLSANIKDKYVAYKWAVDEKIKK